MCLDSLFLKVVFSKLFTKTHAHVALVLVLNLEHELYGPQARTILLDQGSQTRGR